MDGDFSRWTAPNAERQGYAGVLMQQGRLHTDADWNEAMLIQSRRSETALADVVGRTGTPKDGDGFRITTGSGGFAIAAGRYYVDGALIENRAVTTYEDQGGDVAVPPLTEIPDGRTVLVYLEATRAHVTAREDGRLVDPALGGVDTATRIRAAWRVAVQEITLTDAEREALIREARCGGVSDLPGWGPGTGRMTAGTVEPGILPDDSDCLIPPEAGYLSQENQLYRVQIVRGGSLGQARFAWSRENASVEAVLNADDDFMLQGDRDDPALGFVSGGWVEVHDAADRFFGRTGTLTRMTLSDGIATFDPELVDSDQMIRPRVRRWDHGGTSAAGLQLRTTPVELERGIQVAFTAGQYREGDYWVFEARAATGNIVWPPYPLDDPDEPVPPMGWGRRRAPLALAERSGAGLTGITDLRAGFPTLTCLAAEDVGFDDGVCAIGAETVQEALEVLCQRTGAGLCSFVAASATELRAGVAALRPGQSVRICLRGGVFALDEPLELNGLGHVIVEGTGPHTVISVTDGEAALLFRNCGSVRVSDLSVNGGPTGSDGAFLRSGRLGAVTAVDCGDVSIERVRARCRAGLDRSTACLSTRGTIRTGQVLVRDCVLKVGQSQIGVEIIGARRAVVENNLITPVPVGDALIRRRIIADPVLVSHLKHGIMSFPGGRRQPGKVMIRTGPRDTPGQTVDLHGFATAKESTRFPVPIGNGVVVAEVIPRVAQMMQRAFAANRGNRISSPAELRQHMDNVLAEAIRGGPRVRVGSRLHRILPPRLLRVTPSAYLAQGIVIAGDAVDEAHVRANRIEGAIDGIRVAASSRSDERPPRWIKQRPANDVARAVIEGNVITVQPLSDQTAAHGVYLGHVRNVSVGRNDVTPGDLGPGSPDVPKPHFGVYQFGHRGPRLTIGENTVAGLHHGYVVIPTIDPAAGVGVWRLRDNGIAGVERPYVVASDVEVQ